MKSESDYGGRHGQPIWDVPCANVFESRQKDEHNENDFNGTRHHPFTF